MIRESIFELIEIFKERNKDLCFMNIVKEDDNKICLLLVGEAISMSRIIGAIYKIGITDGIHNDEYKFGFHLEVKTNSHDSRQTYSLNLIFNIL